MCNEVAVKRTETLSGRGRTVLALAAYSMGRAKHVAYRIPYESRLLIVWDCVAGILTYVDV